MCHRPCFLSSAKLSRNWLANLGVWLLFRGEAGYFEEQDGGENSGAALGLGWGGAAGASQDEMPA